MEKKALLLLMILGAGIFFSVLCFVLGSSVRQSHEAFCSGSLYSCDYIGEGLLSLFILALTSIFLLIHFIFVPQEFVYALFKPPQLS